MCEAETDEEKLSVQGKHDHNEPTGYKAYIDQGHGLLVRATDQPKWLAKRP